MWPVTCSCTVANVWKADGKLPNLRVQLHRVAFTNVDQGLQSAKSFINAIWQYETILTDIKYHTAGKRQWINTVPAPGLMSNTGHTRTEKTDEDVSAPTFFCFFVNLHFPQKIFFASISSHLCHIFFNTGKHFGLWAVHAWKNLHIF